MYANVSCVKKVPLFWAIIPVYFIIFEIIFTINYYIIFENTSIKNPSFLKLISILIFEPMAILTIITQIKSMFTNPGFVPIPFTYNTSPKKLPDINSNKNVELERNDLYCSKCNNPRPPRSHHCKICGRCVLKMDHHCPWIANCVGYYNQKNFYQFLFYATVGDIIGFLILFYKMINTDISIKGNIHKGLKIHSTLLLLYYMWKPIQIFIGMCSAIAMSISIGFLFYKQTKMLLNNQTTIDKKLYEDWEKSPYYSYYNESKYLNFASVMGNNIIEWFSLKFYGHDPYYLDPNHSFY